MIELFAKNYLIILSTHFQSSFYLVYIILKKRYNIFFFKKLSQIICFPNTVTCVYHTSKINICNKVNIKRMEMLSRTHCVKIQYSYDDNVLPSICLHNLLKSCRLRSIHLDLCTITIIKCFSSIGKFPPLQALRNFFIVQVLIHTVTIYMPT